ncbi:MAG: hypothetical protein KGS45_05220 [Planctomycetes bacterium]|nr:hypothetical protein [Planctomycetota bacterium]
MPHRVHAPAFRRKLAPVAAFVLALTVGLSTTSAFALNVEIQPYPAGYVEPQKRNAALVYWQGWSLITPDVKTAVADIKWDTLEKAYTLDALPKEFSYSDSELFSRSGSCLESLVAAASMPYCNFEVAHEAGAFALMPHLAHYRAGCRVLRYHARCAWVAGKVHRAAEYLAAAIRSANHISHDGVVISGLVAVAGATQGLEEASVFAASGTMTAAAKKVISDAIDTLPANDPAGLAQSIITERDIFLKWIPRHYTGADAGKKLANELLQMNSSTEVAAQQSIIGMDATALAAACKKATGGYDAMAEAYRAADPIAAITQVEQRIKRDEFGEVFKLLAPSVMKIRQSDTKFRDAIAATRKALAEAKLAPADSDSK